MQLPDDWHNALRPQIESRYFNVLRHFIADERSKFEVYPADEDVFAALQLTPLSDVKVVIIGQDPYHDVGQANGLSFSVHDGVPKPPSLVNILRELESDVGCAVPFCGSLSPWARQGVLMLNAVLTVRAHQPNSHRGHGWEIFTDSIIQAVNDQPSHCVFLLWGAAAQRKTSILDSGRHTIIASPHPSPLSAHTGFFGSRPFTRANSALLAHGQKAVNWRLSDSKRDLD